MQEHNIEMASCEPGREASPGANPAGSQILSIFGGLWGFHAFGLPGSRNVRKCISVVQASLWYLVMAPGANKEQICKTSFKIVHKQFKIEARYKWPFPT